MYSTYKWSSTSDQGYAPPPSPPADTNVSWASSWLLLTTKSEDLNTPLTNDIGQRGLKLEQITTWKPEAMLLPIKLKWIWSC